MTTSRRLVSSGSPLEPEIGFSRAVRAGPYICVAGTAPIAEGGGTAAPGDVYGQSVRCLDIAEQALQEAGASLADVVRTRVMLTDIGQWRHAARAHAQRFAQVRPVTTFIEVSRFVDPEWLVEFELDAIVPDWHTTHRPDPGFSNSAAGRRVPFWDGGPAPHLTPCSGRRRPGGQSN